MAKPALPSDNNYPPGASLIIRPFVQLNELDHIYTTKI